MSTEAANAFGVTLPETIAPVTESKPFWLRVAGDIEMRDLEARLKHVGFEMFADCAGHTNVRTSIAGDLHREQVARERRADYLEKNPDMAPYIAQPRSQANFDAHELGQALKAAQERGELVEFVEYFGERRAAGEDEWSATRSAVRDMELG